MVWGTYQLEYIIEVHSDGSATWTIRHVFPRGEGEAAFTQFSNYKYFSDVFVKNMQLLVEAARNKTGRTNMTVERLKIEVSDVNAYRIVTYQFYWVEFARRENARLEIGDVFEIENLFLYGEGRVSILYPLEYGVESVSPKPDVETVQGLIWYGIGNFETGEPKIVLTKKVAFGFFEILLNNAFVVTGSIMLIGVGFISFYYIIKSRKKWKEETAKIEALLPSRVPKIEDNEEKIVNLLKAAGGSLYQSTLAERCGFSRSKTSKLLKEMENCGRIRRKVKGREKIVMLIEQIEEVERAKREGST
jgi:DNA-binding MarR family transcriptional regulator